MVSKFKTEFEVDRELPRNIESEQSVLGSLMIDKEAISRVEPLLSPEDFWKQEHQYIYSAMIDLYKEDTPIDLVSVVDKLKKMRLCSRSGGTEYLASLATYVPTATNVVHYSKIVFEASLRRQLIDRAERIKTEAYNEKIKIDELLEDSDKKITEVLEINSDKHGDDKPQKISGLIDEFKIAYETGNNGISFGIPEFDEELLYLHKGEVVTLQAPTGGKKTMFALNIAYLMSRQLKVLYINLEMNNVDLIERMISIAGGIDSYALKRRGVSEEERNLAYKKIDESNLSIISPASMTVKELERIAKLEQKRNGLDVIIVDHLHLVKSRTKDPIQRVAENAEGIKTIAKKLDVPVLELVQISRYAQANGKKPEKTDVRDSSVVENTAGIMFALSNEAKPTIDINRSENQVNLHVIKNRYGKDGFEIPLKFNWRNLRFYGKNKYNVFNGGEDEKPRVDENLFETAKKLFG